MPPGQLVDRVALEIGQSDQGEILARPRSAFPIRHALEPETELGVLDDVQPGKQGMSLEYHAAVSSRTADQHPLAEDFSARWRQGTGDDVEQRGLAAAGGAERHDESVVAEVQVNAVERPHRARAVYISERHAHLTQADDCGSPRHVSDVA